MKNTHFDENFVYVRLEALSPVHIGAGKDSMLSPLDFQTHEEPDGCWLYTVDSDAWLSQHPDPQSITQQIEKTNINGVWKLFRKELPKELFTHSKSKISKEIHAICLERLYSGKSANELASATRNPLTQAMIIPGSSIKGAIRTAIIDFKDKGELKRAVQQKKYKEQLQAWFGKIGENAFQALKIPDFELLPNASEFVRPWERKLKQEAGQTKDAGMKDICETMPIGTNNLYGKMLIGRTAVKSPNKNPLSFWKFGAIAKVCYDFYYKRMLEEYEKFYKLPHFAGSKHFIEKLMASVEDAKQGKALLLRVGHYSHVESITVENHAPETPKKNGKPSPYGKTRTLADGKYPFGWILIHKIDEQEYTQGVQVYEKEKEDILNKARELRVQFTEGEIKKAQRRAEQEALAKAQKEEDERRKAEAQRKLQEKEAQEAKEKQAEQALINSLSPEDRLVELVIRKKATPDEVLKAYDLLDICDKKIELAQAIRDAWKKEKKWSGKLKGAQQKRVDKVEEILRGVK